MTLVGERSVLVLFLEDGEPGSPLRVTSEATGPGSDASGREVSGWCWSGHVRVFLHQDDQVQVGDGDRVPVQTVGVNMSTGGEREAEPSCHLVGRR